MKRVIFLGDNDLLRQVYSPEARQRVEEVAEMLEPPVIPNEIDLHLDRLGEADAILTTWGMPLLSEQQLRALPRLQAVFYAAGSVRMFAGPLLERGAVVSSAWMGNAVPVAEFTMAQTLLAMKGYFRNRREFRGPEDFAGAYRGPGAFGETVALLGAGAIGRKVIELMAPLRMHILVFDPFLTVEEAAELGVAKVSLEEAFERAFVVSNHLADVPETIKLLKGSLFRRMRPGAVFINTGRGRTVDEGELCAVFAERADLTALLDVTYPEPPEEGAAIYSLPNVQLSTHIAGSINGEVALLGEIAADEFVAWAQGRPLQYAVTRERLATMA